MDLTVSKRVKGWVCDLYRITQLDLTVSRFYHLTAETPHQTVVM